MATVDEVKVTGRKYRIWDAVNSVWKRVSFWTKASDVEFEDGTNLEDYGMSHGSGLHYFGTISVEDGVLHFNSIETISDYSKLNTPGTTITCMSYSEIRMNSISDSYDNTGVENFDSGSLIDIIINDSVTEYCKIYKFPLFCAEYSMITLVMSDQGWFEMSPSMSQLRNTRDKYTFSLSGNDLYITQNW